MYVKYRYILYEESIQSKFTYLYYNNYYPSYSSGCLKYSYNILVNTNRLSHYYFTKLMTHYFFGKLRRSPRCCISYFIFKLSTYEPKVGSYLSIRFFFHFFLKLQTPYEIELLLPRIINWKIDSGFALLLSLNMRSLFLVRVAVPTKLVVCTIVERPLICLYVVQLLSYWSKGTFLSIVSMVSSNCEVNPNMSKL